MKTYKLSGRVQAKENKIFQDCEIRHSWFFPPVRTFVNAWNGITTFFTSEFNARIHLFSAVVVIAASFWFHISRLEFAIIIFCICLVLVTEMINTALEKAMDFISLEEHDAIRIVKDVAAGAVLVATIGAVVTAAIIFIPKIFHV